MSQFPDEKTVGILGGMGPEATVDLMRRVIRLTPAQGDADHIRCIVDVNPKVPSRIKAIIEGTGESPGPCLADMARGLTAWGADFLAIACNTAHYYHPEIQAAVAVPVLNMIELAVAAVAERVPGATRVGVLATPAIAMTGLYDRPLAARGLRAVYPAPLEQERLFAVVKAIKSGDTGRAQRAAFADVVAHVAGLGAQAAIISCTELGIVAEGEFGLPVLDAAEVLAEEIVAVARGGKALAR